LAGLGIQSWCDGIVREELTTAQGLRLQTYHAGPPEAEAVLLINPIGVSMLLLAPLMRQLAKTHFVLNWETRGLPSLNPGSLPSMEIGDHLEDARALLAHHRIRRLQLVSYCSGTSIALSLLASGSSEVTRAVFVSPSILIRDAIAMTAHQRTVVPIWEDVAAKGPDYCAIVSNLMAPARPTGGDIATELDYVNRLPFVDGQSTYLYARLLASANRIVYGDLFARLATPVLLLHAEDDELIHVELSRYLARRLPQAQLQLIERGGHYAICSDGRMHDHIGRFLAPASAAAA
jgi:pimeloyl-ACP methyl ester carboxylesterase